MWLSRELRRPVAAALRVGYAVLVYAVGLAFMGGCTVLVVVAADYTTPMGPLTLIMLVAALLAIWAIMGVISNAFDSIAAGLSAGAVMAAALVSGLALSTALNERTLHDRGVVEKAVVTAEYDRCRPQVDDIGCDDDYSCSLRNTAGRPILPDMLQPSQNLHLSAHAAWVVAISVGAAGAACLLVVAWAAPVPAVISRRMRR